jgi:hypothetical protein
MLLINKWGQLHTAELLAWLSLHTHRRYNKIRSLATDYHSNGTVTDDNGHTRPDRPHRGYFLSSTMTSSTGVALRQSNVRLFFTAWGPASAFHIFSGLRWRLPTAQMFQIHNKRLPLIKQYQHEVTMFQITMSCTIARGTTVVSHVSHEFR